MLFSYNWLQEFIKGKLPAAEKLAELFASHVFEIESVEKKGDDWILDVSVLPQRGDCLSHEGLAREIAAITGKEFQGIQKTSFKVQKGMIDQLRVSIAAKKLVPRYSALVLEDVVVAPSPQWMQERLAVLGINSINNVVDITNLVMREVGQPLHAFDFNEIQGHAMNVRESRKEERIALLDDTELTLPQGVLIIEDGKEIIDLAGIRGGKSTMIKKNTKNIVLQAASFDRQSIYKAKKKLGYGTDAADFYSHELDPNMTTKALERALHFILKFGGGRVVQSIDLYPVKRNPKIVPFTPDAVRRLLGIKIEDRKIKEILSGLGFLVSAKNVKVPTWRQDVTIPEDVVEEIGRMYGYKNIEGAFPQAHILPPEPNMERAWQDQIQNSLKEAGCTEVYNYSFIGKKDTSLLGYAEHDLVKLVELENPISADFEYMRDSLLPNLIKNVVVNEKGFGKGIKLFEIGKVFEKSPKGFSEQQTLGIVCAVPNTTKDQGFYILKGIADVVFSHLGIGDLWYDNFQATPVRGRSFLWNMPRTAEIKIGDKEFGFMGEISPRIASLYKIGMRVVGLEVNLTALLEHALEEREYSPPSKFPATLRDIAIVVPYDVKVEQILNVMETSGGILVADIDLFDMYEGQELGEDQKSLAFHMVYQANDRTLTNKEVDAVHHKIINALKEQGWNVRD